MRIVHYDEVDHDEVLAMNLSAFGWPITEDAVKSYLKHDERWMDIVGVYAVEGGRTVGQTLPLRIRTRTSEGLETVGGIAGVTVVPNRARRGVATTLMKATHDIFRENDIRIAFLLTAESLVAYSLYLKLGSFDALSLGSARKFVTTPRMPRNAFLRQYRRRDWKTTDGIYFRAVRGLLGFVARQPAFLNMKMDTTPMPRKDVYLAGDNETTGYVVKSQGEGYVIVREIMCPTEKAFSKVMASIEVEAAQKHVFANIVTSRRLKTRFEGRGYRIGRRTWGRVMVSPLVQRLTQKRIRELYDFDQSFCMTNLDVF